MRRIISSIAVVILLISMIGCAKTFAPTWEEQYDLGVRYLSEGKYEEAIIAFTAAIEIDPKQSPAYVGRGDAYVGQAASPVAGDNYNSAVTDYITAIDLDPLTAGVYEKLGKVYIEQGDFDAATDILERGYEATKDEKLSELLEMLHIELNGPAAALLENLEMMRAELEGPVTVTGRIINNLDEHRDTWYAYREQYQNESAGIHCSIPGFGIRFEQTQRIISENGIEYIEEAQVGLEHEALENLVGCTVEFTGYFMYTGEAELSGPFSPGSEYGYFDDDTYYHYNPNGPWFFSVESYVIGE